MTYPIFSEEWIREWVREIEQSEAYRRAAASWEGSLTFEIQDDDGGTLRAAFLDLWHGECRLARPASAEDLETTDFLLSAPLPVWKKVLAGDLEPIFGLMVGKIRLRRGSLAKLTPQMKAGKELVAAAGRVSTAFPGEETPTEAPARRFKTLSPGGLDFRLPPMTLWRKAKKLGIWDPQDIDLTVDAEHWSRFDALEKEVLLHLTCLFQAGEESVTLDLLPLIQVIAEEGRLEEEMYLTSFLWEEAKHVEAFRRFLDEVAGETGDLSRFETPSYRRIFHHELPTALSRLRRDSSPVAQAEASVTYNMIVEGVLAETGYHAYHTMLAKNELMPGMQQVVAHLKGDESRHLAYGVFLLSRLVAEHGEEVWGAIEQRMGALLPAAVGVINELFDTYDALPFGLQQDEFVDFATRQFQKRFQRIERARRQTLEEVCRLDTQGTAEDTAQGASA